jgi:hypothetical protein
MPKTFKRLKTAVFVIILTVAAGVAMAQAQPPAPPRPAANEEDSVKKVINIFFEGLQKGDTALIRTTIHENLVLQTVALNRKGEAHLLNEPIAEFMTSVAVRPPEIKSMEERIVFETIKLDVNLASVWTPYQFFVNEKLYHCGNNSFQLMKGPQGWKIVHIIDTRRRKGCE